MFLFVNCLSLTFLSSVLSSFPYSSPSPSPSSPSYPFFPFPSSPLPLPLFPLRMPTPQAARHLFRTSISRVLQRPKNRPHHTPPPSHPDTVGCGTSVTSVPQWWERVLVYWMRRSNSSADNMEGERVSAVETRAVQTRRCTRTYW